MNYRYCTSKVWLFAFMSQIMDEKIAVIIISDFLFFADTVGHPMAAGQDKNILHLVNMVHVDQIPLMTAVEPGVMGKHLLHGGQAVRASQRFASAERNIGDMIQTFEKQDMMVRQVSSIAMDPESKPWFIRLSQQTSQ